MIGIRLKIWNFRQMPDGINESRTASVRSVRTGLPAPNRCISLWESDCSIRLQWMSGARPDRCSCSLLYEPQPGLSAPRLFGCSYLTNCRCGGRYSPLQASMLVVCRSCFCLRPGFDKLSLSDRASPFLGSGLGFCLSRCTMPFAGLSSGHLSEALVNGLDSAHSTPQAIKEAASFPTERYTQAGFSPFPAVNKRRLRIPQGRHPAQPVPLS